MVKTTLKEARSGLAHVAGEAGLSNSPAEFTSRINMAIGELMNAGAWPSVILRYSFDVFDGWVTLPADLDRIIKFAVDYAPRSVAPPWYEFLGYGVGVQDAYDWIDMAIDQGEGPTFRDIPWADGPYRLQVKAYTDERDAAGGNPVLKILGRDSSGEPVSSTDSTGAYVRGMEYEINGHQQFGGPVNQQAFSAISQVVKPVTKDRVDLFAASDYASFHIARFAPRETTPSYRRYLIPSLQRLEQHRIIARCRRRYIPASHDDDVLIIGNIPALENMLIAGQKRREQDESGYQFFRRAATEIMAEEAKAYNGDNYTYPIEMHELAQPLGNIPAID